MAKITKDFAKRLAEKLTEGVKAKYWEEHKKLRELAGEIYKKFVPVDILEMFEKHPAWIEKRNYFHLYQNGFNGECINFEPSLPSKHSGPSITPSEKDCECLRKQKDKADKMGKDYDQLKKDIENAVLTLGTSKKVAEVFPDAIEFINEYFDVKHLPAVVNIESIRQRLK